MLSLRAAGHVMSLVDIRTLSADDWAIWRAARLRALADAPEAFGSKLADWEGDNDREARWRARFDDVDFNAVATVAGGVAGTVGALRSGARTAELISMWVAPEHRGSGVGVALIDAVHRWAGSVGMTQLRLAVRRNNDRAVSLYERTGFRRIGPNPDDATEELMICTVAV